MVQISVMADYAAAVDDGYTLSKLVDVKKTTEKEYHIRAHVTFVEHGGIGSPDQARRAVNDDSDSGSREIRKGLNQRRFKFFMLRSKHRNLPLQRCPAAGRR